MKYLEILRAKLAALTEQRNAVVADMEAATEPAVAEERSTLTEEETAAFDEARARLAPIDAEIKTVNASIADLEVVAERSAAAAKAPTVIVKPDQPAVAEVRRLSGPELRDAALRVLDNESNTRHLASDQKDQVERLIRARASSRDRNCDGAEIARRMLVTETDEYRSAFQKVTTQATPFLTAAESAALEELRAMNIGTDASGGFGVPVLIDPTIILTGQGSPDDIYNLARVETITANEWKGVSSAGVTWSFDAEAAEVSDDSPTLAQPTVEAHKAQGFIPFTIEVGADYPGFAAEMSMLLNEGYFELLAQKLTLGSGTGEPTGIVTALDANSAVEVLPTTDGAFAVADLYKLWDALPVKYRGKESTAWMSSTDVQNEARNFGATLGSSFSVDITQESIPRLFGKRYFQNDYMADFTADPGKVSLLIVGDWKNYLVAQRAGMSVELVPHLFATANNRPSGQRGWYAHARIGADSINDLGFRLLQNQ